MGTGTNEAVGSVLCASSDGGFCGVAAATAGAMSGAKCSSSLADSDSECVSLTATTDAGKAQSGHSLVWAV